MDVSTLAGLLFAFGGIILGLVLEGGNVGQLTQPTAAIIVLGGTLGAVMVQFPLHVVLDSLKSMAKIVIAPKSEPHAAIKQLVEIANQARKEGIISLDKQLGDVQDPFLKKALMLAIDGTEPQELRKMMELELETQAEHDEHIPQFFESAGGFAPTVGIIGAVLGLIQVMQHLDNIEEVGHGIAVAFVATVYGVALANLIFLPAAGKLKIRSRESMLIREIMLEGVISILEGLNPRIVEAKLQGFLTEALRKEVERQVD